MVEIKIIVEYLELSHFVRGDNLKTLASYCHDYDYECLIWESFKGTIIMFLFVQSVGWYHAADDTQSGRSACQISYW